MPLAFSKLFLRFIFQSGQRLSSFVVFNDRIPILLRSRIVYEHSFQCCLSSYLGQTKRLLHTHNRQQRTTTDNKLFITDKLTVINHDEVTANNCVCESPLHFLVTYPPHDFCKRLVPDSSHANGPTVFQFW